MIKEDYGLIYGTPVYVINDKVQAKTHKWKWLNFLYLKMYGMKEHKNANVCYVFDGGLYCGHKFYEELKKEVENV